MKIGKRVLGPDEQPYIIAEIGVNHDGSVERAIELVHAAKQARANAIKLQLFQTDLLLSKAAKLAGYQKSAGAKDPFAMLRTLELSASRMQPIADTAVQLGLDAVVTVFSVELVAEAEQIPWSAYKTASPDIINRPLIEALIATGRPLIVSARGAATLHEIAQAAQWIGNHPHALMQCVSAYPTPDDEASLNARIAMCKVDANAIGYSDHTADVITGAIAVASGTRLLEKHLTYNRHASGPDHAASLDPQQFAEYVHLAHRAYRMLGGSQKDVLAVERDVHQVSRQSLTSVRRLSAGTTLKRADLTIKRPGSGISPAQLNQVIGRKLSRAVDADMPIVEEDLER